MTFYLLKSDNPKFRYFFTDKEKASLLFLILTERYKDKAIIEFKTLTMSDNITISTILDDILIKDFE